VPARDPGITYLFNDLSKEMNMLKKLLLALSLVLAMGFAVNLYADYTVNFEGTGETKTAYASGTVNLSGLDWNMTDALIGTDAADFKNGLRSARMRGYGTSSMTMLADKASGIGTVSFLYRRYGTDAQVDWKVEYSTNGGTSWTQIGSPFTAPASDDVQTFSESVNSDGNIRIRIKRATESGTSNRRLNIDDITITDYSGGNPLVATPAITPGTDNYYAAFGASISCVTPGATIYYTIDGTDPDQTSDEYDQPISISQTTTLKARAYASGYDPSQIATATYTFPTVVDVANIAALRAGLTDGTVYRLTGTGILTFQYTGTGYKHYYIQDNSAAIMIYDNAGTITTAYNQYDGINNIIGTLALYNGLLELIPEVNTPAAVSSGNTITPEVKTLATITANDQSKLVRLNGITFGSTGTFAYNINYPLTDASGSGTMRTSYNYVDYLGTVIPVDIGDLVCLVGWFNAAQVTPRDLADFIDFGSVPYLEVDPATLSGFTYVVGNGPSTEQSFTVSGIDLTDNIVVSAPTHYELALASVGPFAASQTLVPVGGSVAETTIYVRLVDELAVGEYNGEIIDVASTGATALTVTCNGEVTAPPPPDAPVALPATSVTETGFNANWEASAGATGYYLDVYTIAAATATDLIISEYIEGSSNNKALEIYNGTGVDVDLSDYTIHLYSNGATVPSTTYILEMSGTLANGDVYIVANSGAAAEVLAIADITSTVTYYNGDDAVVLYKESTTTNVDIIGCIGEDPGTAWTSGNHSTVEQTLVRKFSVTAGVSTNPAAGFPTLETEWDSHPQDTFAYLGSHAMGTLNYVAGYQNLNVGNVTTYPVTGLTTGTTYYYVVRAYNAYGASDNSNSVSVTAGAAITLTAINEAELINIPGYPSDEYSTYQVVGNYLSAPITVTAPEHFEVSTSTDTGYDSSIELAYNYSGYIYVRINSSVVGEHSGTLSLASEGAQGASAQLIGETVEPPITWNITENLTAFSHEVGTPSAYQSYTLSATGAYSSSTLDLSVDGPFEISTSASGPWSGFLGLAYDFNGSVYVRMNSSVAGNFTGSILHETTDASPATIDLEGTATPPAGNFASELFFSEYIEGSSNNKAIEIFNGTGAAVDLSDYQFENWYNGLLTPFIVPLSGTLAHGDVYVLANPSSIPEILALADDTSGNVSFNGDDALALRKISTDTIVDIFGCIGEDPGTQWGTEPEWTINKTMVRNSDVTGGVTVNPTTGFPTLTTEWTFYDIDTISYLGSHVFCPGGGDLDTPVVQIIQAGGTITLSWDAITGATYYEIWSASDPYGTYTLAEGNWTGTTWSETSAVMKFYKVIAKN